MLSGGNWFNLFLVGEKWRDARLERECIMTENNLIVGGRYLILEEIGKGGMGKVFKAKDVINRKIFALKQYITSDPKNRERLIEDIERELNVLKHTTHPVLPTIYNLITEDDKFFLVMEYVEGTNLKEIVDRQGVLPESQLLEVMEQVCSGLYYLHSLNPPIVYRDLKPSNIIYMKSGNIKLIDFGIAKRYNREQAADEYAYGTKGFAAPEQFGKANGIGIYNTDIRSDIYGIGTTLFYLYTGRKYKGNVKSLLIPKKMQKIIRKCTYKKPKDRYQSCIDVICQIKNCRISMTRKVIYPIIKKVTRKQ